MRDRFNQMEPAEIRKLENRFASIKARINNYHPESNMSKIRQGFEYALEKHAGQYRKSGEPYLSHPLEVLDIIAELKLDTACLIAGLLHDTVEDTDATIEEIEELFGKDVAVLVNGVTKFSKVPYKSREEEQAENVRKMLLASMEDCRVLLIKLADRLHNMRTLKHMAREKQIRIATETMEIYAPLANRAGISWLKTELEDLSFQYLYPEDYYKIAELVSQKKREREGFVREVEFVLRELLEENGIEAKVSGRSKHFWSIYRKMKRGNTTYEQLYDIQAFRVIVNDVQSCYDTIGYVHELWKPIQGRFKDYINNRKENGYQSLHTSVVGPNSERIEIQIRTQQMHDYAEGGFAAHWLYKEGKAVSDRDKVYYDWLHHIFEEHAESGDPVEFYNAVRNTQFFEDEIFVSTPQGEVKSLPLGATVLDFAYCIHTEVGHRCIGAVVDGRMVPLSYKLRTHETCNILTSKTPKSPTPEWLKMVKTKRAIDKIRNRLREEDRRVNREIGRELFERELRKQGTSYSAIVKSGELDKFFNSRSGYQNETELFLDIGYGKKDCEDIVDKILASGRKKSPIRQVLDKICPTSTISLEIDGINKIKHTFAKCCNPLPGEDLIGFITRGRGLSVHVRHCDKISHLDPARFVNVTVVNHEQYTFRAKLSITFNDSTGILAEITQVFANFKANIIESNSIASRGESLSAKSVFVVDVRNAAQIGAIMKKIRMIKGVTKVVRQPVD